jgi:uncharacterized protein (TIGR02594 family)
MGRYRVTAQDLNVREEPKLTGRVIGVLEKDEEVTGMSISGDGYWYKIASKDDLVGWSSHKYLVSLENEGEIRNEEFPWMSIAIRETGIKEYSGAADNPRIVEYLSSTTLGSLERLNDETSWCSAFVNWCVEKSGYAGTDSAWARSWEQWGRKADRPRRGCIVVFKRPCNSGDGEKRCGHVAFYVEETSSHVRVLGGNQLDAVCILPYPKDDVLAYRIPG